MLDIFEGLNEDQRVAVAAVRGPVCILAGAGTGKTTTITRRIAHQVRSGVFAPREILAVTFTDKAANEMVRRLEQLSVPRVRARTFHAAALGVYKSLLEGRGELLGSKARILVPLIKALPSEYQQVPVGDFAQEIEWAKNRRIGAKTYPEALGSHRAPLPVDLMQGVYLEYERIKRQRGQIDFEDLLGYTARMLKSNPQARRRLQLQYRAFTVDEYQDANLLWSWDTMTR